MPTLRESWPLPPLDKLSRSPPPTPLCHSATRATTTAFSTATYATTLVVGSPGRDAAAARRARRLLRSPPLTATAAADAKAAGAAAPGVAAALGTTVAGLLVAIPSMVGYNWLVHNLRVFTVELDNFAQELASCMETEFLKDE